MTTEQLRTELEQKDAEAIICRALETFGSSLVFATSLAAEDQVITDIIARNRWPIPFVTLDTGRLFPETYTLLAETEKRYGIKIKTFFPDRASVEAMVAEKGINLFYDSVENRKSCCSVRKIEPLRRALQPYRAWLCGLRREQSVTRSAIYVVEDDIANGLTKVNPLAAWSEQEVWGYIARCLTARCMIMGFPASDARAARARSSARKMSAPAGGGGSSQSTRKADCMAVRI